MEGHIRASKMKSLGIMVEHYLKQEAEPPVGIHTSYIVEFFATDYFRHRDRLGSFEITAPFMAIAVEYVLERMSKLGLRYAKVQERDSTFFELFRITHGIYGTVVTGLRNEDHAENHSTVGSIVRADEAGHAIGICGRDVA